MLMANLSNHIQLLFLRKTSGNLIFHNFKEHHASVHNYMSLTCLNLYVIRHHSAVYNSTTTFPQLLPASKYSEASEIESIPLNRVGSILT